MRGDCRASGATGVEGGVLITGHWSAVLIIGGTLPGMLLHVRGECVCFVFFNRLGAVGFGVVIIGGGICDSGKRCFHPLLSDLFHVTLHFHPLFHPLF